MACNLALCSAFARACSAFNWSISARKLSDLSGPLGFFELFLAVRITLTEAERTRRELEPFLIEAIGARKKLGALEEELTAVSTRILMMGGITVPYAKLAQKRMEHQALAEIIKDES